MIAMAQPQKDRRRSQRLTRAFPCSMRQASAPEGRAAKAVISDISLHGAQLQSSESCAMGAKVVLDFMLLGAHLENVPATVVRVSPAGEGFSYGVEFAGDAAGRIEQAMLNPRQQSILLIDDDLRLRNSMERRLVSAGYIVSAAE